MIQSDREPRIELLIGMIASGKSTYARKRADEGALVVSHDDLTQMLHGRYRYEAVLKLPYRAMMREIAYLGLESGRDVVIDRTHLDRGSREFWVITATTAAVPIIAVVFSRMDVETHAFRRLKADGRGRSYDDWLAVASHHEGQAIAEPLEWEAEGFTGVINMEDSR